MIQAVGHDSSSNTLTVRFKNGREYTYPCTPGEFQDLLSAQSIGKHFIANFKGKER
jgi:hypothetical protein